MNDDRRRRWERMAEWPLTVSAVVFLGAYAWPILQPGLPPAVGTACRVLSGVTWGAFAADYVVRLLLARRRWRFVYRHPLDLAVVVLPMLRPLRLLRLVTLFSVLNRYAGSSLRGRVVLYVCGSTSLVLFVASLAVLQAERGQPGATISSFGDALWWAAVTVATVGYGDTYPVTATGRLVGAGLMIAGVSLLGLVTATLASWIIDRVQEVEEGSQQATRHDIDELRREIGALRAELRSAAPDPHPAINRPDSPDEPG